jgi:tRNA U34 5-methylaminomethyl-2-thiouridine-forming methyltransferase MnmC
MNRVKIIETKDGSHSLYREDLDETYHSRHGALSESQHVFIRNGLCHWIEKHKGAEKMSILEIGFGTGLNAALTFQYSHSSPIEISYVTLEPFPLDMDTVEGLNYFNKQQDQRQEFLLLHELSWSEKHELGNFTFLKAKSRIEEYFDDRFFDVVYFDAFAPEKQPELWDIQVLQKVFSMMNEGGVMVTYCAKGEFKRNLKKTGFEVTTLSGPAGGKREMVRGVIGEKKAIGAMGK